MSASATDLFQEVGINTATTLDAPGYTIGGTSVTVVSTSNWPTATGITFAMDEIDANGDQVAGSYNEYVGTVASATSITNVSHENGTDQDFSAGTTTRVYIPVSAERENRLVEGILEQHKQDGTHADTITTDTINENTSANGVTVDGLNIKDSKLATANSVVTANYTDGSILPEHLVASTGTSWVWQSWSPSYANITVGDGTVVAKYIQIGKTVHFRWSITVGSTTALGNAITISLPVAAEATYGLVRQVMGFVQGSDVGTANFNGWAYTQASTTVMSILWNDGTAPSSATFPFTEAANDFMTVTGTYEAA